MVIRMKIRISINEQHLSTGEVLGKGHLGAHINLNDNIGSGKPKMDIFLSGYDTNNSEETKYLKWCNSILENGDLIEIEMMPDVPADDPSEIKSSLRDKKTINTTEEQAEQILKASYSCNELLNKMLHELKNEFSVGDYKKLAFGVGKVISEVFSSIAEPIYRKHPSKVPEELKDMPL
jgi:hypothetical protein